MKTQSHLTHEGLHEDRTMHSTITTIDLPRRGTAAAAGGGRLRVPPVVRGSTGREPAECFLRSAGALLLGAAIATAAHADFLDNPRPPALLEYATPTPQLSSRAVAISDFDGSRRRTACDDSWAFWSCRELYSAAGEDRQQRQDDGIAAAERGSGTFARVDHTHAESWARARSNFGSNRAEAHAYHSFTWTETRVNSAWDPTTNTIDGASSAWAFAESLWAEAFTVAEDGPLTLQFVLRQHGVPGDPPFVLPGPYERFWSDGEGVLEIQVFDLDTIVSYDRGDGSPIDGPALVAATSLVRSFADGVGSSPVQLSFDLLASTNYALVSRLSLSAYNDARIDMYGTAELERILVAPGQSLVFASGTSYTVSVVPEPAAWALMLGGLGVVLRRAGRRARQAGAAA